jgi:hypothetical protein
MSPLLQGMLEKPATAPPSGAILSQAIAAIGF